MNLNLNPAPLTHFFSLFNRRPVWYETIGNRKERQGDLVDWILETYYE